VTAVRREPIVRPRFGLKDHSVPATKELEWEYKVVENGLSRERDEEFPTYSAEGACVANTGPEAALQAAHTFLVSPVEAEALALSWPLGIEEEQFTADRTDLGVAKAPYELGDGVGREPLASVGKDDDLAACRDGT
jgi:hypothetical protein